MPFFTYTVKNEIFENYRNLDVKKFQKFLYDIEDLNISKKAILVEDVNNSLLNKILKTQNYLSRETLRDGNQQILNVLLTDAYRIFDISNKVQNSMDVEIDFIKDEKNEIERNLKKKVTKGQYNYNDFDGEAEKLKKKFFGKIKEFINSQNNNKKKIDRIYIFHKELANMVLPIIRGEKRNIQISFEKKGKSIVIDKKVQKVNLNNNLQDYLNSWDLCKNEKIDNYKYFIKNLKIIRHSMDLIVNWWLSFDKEKVPNKIDVISDIPRSLEGENIQNIIKAEKMINIFLFNTLQEMKLENIETSFKFIDKIEFKNIPELKNSDEVWTHKRHFIFGTNQNFVFSSHFGVEMISDKDSNKIREKTILEVEDDEKDNHLFHFKYLIPYFHQKIEKN